MQTQRLSPYLLNRVNDGLTKGPANHYFIDKSLSLLCLVCCLPFFLLNYVIARINGQVVFNKIQRQDCLGRHVSYLEFNCGIFRKTAYLLSILGGRVALCGIPFEANLSRKEKLQLMTGLKHQAGFINKVNLCRQTGLAVHSDFALVNAQIDSGIGAYFSLLFKATFNQLFYKKAVSKSVKPSLSIFGIRINNITMQQAVSWVISKNKTADKTCKIAYFVNANSINVGASKPAFVACLNQSDMTFADGSGIRMAAQSVGETVKDNVNGTDMLPLLCQQIIDLDASQRPSLYLLGAKSGVAEATANNLQRDYPGLPIAGTHHGYFKNDTNMLETINQSGASILLLAMGSPQQEMWLQQYKSQLNCQSALAVGGLFDFYSGSIPRAPIWMRELGMEWLFRLAQEPKTKFHRYVIGTPTFLLRTYVLKQVRRGF